MRTIIPTSSFVFRHHTLDVEYLKTFENISGSLDWVTQLIIIRNGRFKYFNEVWSVYNNNKGGMTKNVSAKTFIRNNVKVLRKLLDDDFYSDYKQHIYQMLCTEATNMFFLEDPTVSKKEKVFLVVKYLYYAQKQVFYQVRAVLR
jgi:hypothetical protein